jgi:predicted RND superfamily exporter protein
MKRFGAFLLRYRILLLIIIVIVTGVCGIFLPDLRMEDDETTWFSEKDQLLITYNEFKENFMGGDFAIVAYESDSVLSEPELEYLAHLTETLNEVPYVTKVTSLTSVEDILGTANGMEVRTLVEPGALSEEEKIVLRKRIEGNPFYRGNLISDDYRIIAAVLSLYIPKADETAHSDVSKQIARALRAIVGDEEQKTGRRFYVGGTVITDSEIGSMMERDIAKFFPLSLLLVSIMLIVMYRNFNAFFFPLMTVLIALVWTLGIMGMLKLPITPVSTSLFALITVIGIADSVHLISHYRLELPRLKSKKDAILETYRRAGLPCLFTSLTTAVGFGSLGISSIPAVRNLGFFAGFGIMSAFILSMILVPFGLLISRSAVRSQEQVRSSPVTRLLTGIGTFNARFPLLVVVLGSCVVVAMFTGIWQIRVEGSMLEYLKRDSLLRRDAGFLDAHLAGVSSTEIIIRGENDLFKEPGVLEQVRELQELMMKHPRVTASYSIVDYLKLINRAMNNDDEAYAVIPATKASVAQDLLLYEISGGTEIEDYVTIDYDMARISLRTQQMKDAERQDLIEHAQGLVDSLFGNYDRSVTGMDNLIHMVTQRIIATQTRSLGLAFIVILGLMLLLFGLRGGLASILPNVFPIVFLLGLMGYGRFYLNVATSIIASIAIGIVVDDTIHYFSHFRHELKRLGDREKAMRVALRQVGRALVATSVILTLGFSIFLISDSKILVDFGLLSCAAIIMALLGDLFIGPVLLSRLRIFHQS